MTGLVRLWCKAPDLRVAGYLCAFVRSHGAPGAFYSRIPRVLALAMRELSAPLTITCSFGERGPANRRAAFENQLRNCSDHAPGGRPPDSDTEPDGRCGSLSEGLSEVVSMGRPYQSLGHYNGVALSVRRRVQKESSRAKTNADVRSIYIYCGRSMCAVSGY